METIRVKDYVDYLEMALYLKINTQIKSIGIGEDEIEKCLEFTSDHNGICLTKEQLDERVLNTLPLLMSKLKDGTFDYQWTIHDFYYDYEMLMREPRLKDIYKKYLRLQKIKMAGTNNPIYFDIVRLAIRDKNYVPYTHELIKEGLYDPNQWDDFVSPNPFYRLFTYGHPNIDSEEMANTVLLDERTDYNCLLNGSDCIDWWIRKTGNHCKNGESLPSEFFLLERVLKENNISIIDGKRHNDAHYSYDMLGHINELVGLDCYGTNENIKNFLDYMVSDEYIQKQVAVSRYPSLYRDDSIDIYCDYINKKRGSNIDKLDKLKQLKLF